MRDPAGENRISAVKTLVFAVLAVLFCTYPAIAVDVPIDGGAGLAQDNNPNYLGDIRDNYFKRFPFARAAKDADITVPAAASGKPDLKSVDQLINGGIQRALGWPYEPVPTPPVVPYVPFVKFCQDLPFLGICYFQASPPVINQVSAARDVEVFENQLTTFGYPMSDTQFQIIDRENNQRLLELIFDPERAMWLSTEVGMMQGAAASNSLSQSAEATFQNATGRITGDLMNIANDKNLGQPANNPTSIESAVAMVQALYHNLFVPMAVLFLLPGAVLTQVRSTTISGFLKGGGDGSNPFEGILRATIALFLIPATQVIVSYSIDIGNSLAEAVEPWIDYDALIEWSVSQTYDPKPENFKNVISPPTPIPGGAETGISSLPDIGAGMASSLGQGKAAESPEKITVMEEQLWLSQILQAGFNVVNYSFSESLIVLTAYQVAFMCYLFLLGPLVAAFFAWPEISDTLFRKTFGKWVNAVTALALWRFYWCVILAVMTQRIFWLKELGLFDPESEFEMMVFTCFLGMLLVVPFQPFNFDPGSIAEAVLKKGSSAGKSMATGVASGAVNNLKAAGAPDQVVQSAEQKLSDIQEDKTPYTRIAKLMGSVAGKSQKEDDENNATTSVSAQTTGPPPQAGHGQNKSVQSDLQAGSPPPLSGQSEPVHENSSQSTPISHVGLAPSGAGNPTKVMPRTGFPQPHVESAMQALPHSIGLLAESGMTGDPVINAGSGSTPSAASSPAGRNESRQASPAPGSGTSQPDHAVRSASSPQPPLTGSNPEMPPIDLSEQRKNKEE